MKPSFPSHKQKQQTAFWIISALKNKSFFVSYSFPILMVVFFIRVIFSAPTMC